MIDKQLNYGRHLIKKFISQAESNTSILDIGAGRGQDLLFAREINNKTELYAVENYPPYIKNLQDNAITVYNLDIERDKLPFDNESLDIIIVNQVLEHVKDVFWILHEITRVLKKGGHLIVGLPNLASFHNRLLLLLGEQPTIIQNNTAHVRGYTKSDFKKLLDSGFDSGYSLAHFGGSNFYPFPSLIAKPLAHLLPSMAWGIFMDWKKERPYLDNGFLKYPVEKQLETRFYLG
ncbi:class I SAM-dependent methyltransferase [Adhaeribacter swui]|uniref:Class I SAM-dependent methyltransferase n=1 Tax=Adhaeribacter swui TaxID=2086471 RepID=A0A7G7GCW1_9BACT|nr:class I SAM-dependent methyltransferase [Adhaeribacter swui]QNF34995.1 class I SAM-dependent methyltransferase [Adhaeribacter swui]